jgi:hypothetical protein
MWHIPHLVLQVAPKEKIAHRQVRIKRGPRRITLFIHHAVGQEISPEDIE